MVPAEAGPKTKKLQSLNGLGAEAKFWLSASNIAEGGGGLGGKGGSMGGGAPPTVYVPSNTSLPPPSHPHEKNTIVPKFDRNNTECCSDKGVVLKGVGGVCGGVTFCTTTFRHC